MSCNTNIPLKEEYKPWTILSTNIRTFNNRYKQTLFYQIANELDTTVITLQDTLLKATKNNQRSLQFSYPHTFKEDSKFLLGTPQNYTSWSTADPDKFQNHSVEIFIKKNLAKHVYKVKRYGI